MPQSDFISRWAEIASDRLNPILVKESRQALKSRQFLATFAIMLFGGWLISAFVLMMLSVDYDDRPVGRDVFSWYYGLLSLTVMLVVPFGAFRSLLAERDLNTYELLSITTLSPRQVVWGKWLSSMMQMFIYFSAVSPFIAFTYLLRGVDFPTLAYVMCLSMFASMMFSLASLTLSTFAKQRQIQVVLSLVLLGGLMMAFIMSIGTAYGMITWGGGFTFDKQVFWAIVICVSYYVAAFSLFLQIARAQLTFASDNRSTGIRVTCSVVFLMTLGWLALGLYETVKSGGVGSIDNDFLISVISFLAVFWSIVALFAATEHDELSRRNLAKLPRSRLLRLLKTPFLPGGGRGYLYCGLHLGILVGLSYAALKFVNLNSWFEVQRVVAGLVCYILIYSGLACVMARWLRSMNRDIPPSRSRTFTLVMFSLGWLAPNMFNMFRGRNPITSQYFFLSDPVTTLKNLSGGGPRSDELLTVLAVIGALVILLNLRAVFRGISETITAEPISEPVGQIPKKDE